MSILLLFLASRARSDAEEGSKELQEDMEVLVRKYMGNATVTSQSEESNRDVEVTNSHSKRHTKRKRKCKKGRKGKKCSSKSKKRNKTKSPPSKKRCKKSEKKCWRRISTKCQRSPKCSRKHNKKCNNKYKKCMSKLKKVIPVVTTTTTTMVTPKSRYSTFTGYAEHPWSGNNPNPQKPDNEPIKKLHGYMEDCQVDGDCYDGMCCTYHGSYRRVCKHNIKKDQVCTKQFLRPKRAAMQDWYAQCPCEVGLKCKGTQEDRYWFCRP